MPPTILADCQLSTPAEMRSEGAILGEGVDLICLLAW